MFVLVADASRRVNLSYTPATTMAYRHTGNPPPQVIHYTNMPAQFQQQRPGQRTHTQPQVFSALPVIPQAQQPPHQQRRTQTTLDTHFQPPTQTLQPYDQFALNVTTRVMAAVAPVLEEQSRQIVGRVDRLESSVRNTVTNIEKQVEVANLNLAKALQAAHNQQRTVTTNVLSQVKQLNEAVDTLKPLVNQVDMTVMELYERVNDREAGVSEMAKTLVHELGIDPSQCRFQDQEASTGDKRGDEAFCSPSLDAQATMQQRQSQSPSIRMPSVNFSPARWPSKEGPGSSTSVAVFKANLSPAGRRSYSIIPETPPDGTISSLRRVSLGGDPFLESDTHVQQDLPMTPPRSTSVEVDAEIAAIPEPFSESPDWGSTVGVEGTAEPTTDLSTDEANTKSPTTSVCDVLQISQMISIPSRAFTADPTPSPLTSLNSPSPFASPVPALAFLNTKVKAEAIEEASSAAKSSRKPRKRRQPTESSSASVSSTGAPPAKRAKKKSTSVPKKIKVLQWLEEVIPQTDFVQCDQCRSWYHIGCLGMTADDPRLEDGVRYECLPCVAPAEHPRVGATVTTDNEPQRCGRPDCHQVDEVFIVERIIGKQTLTGGEGRKNMWLTKWFSYPAAQATWEDVEQTVTNASRFIEEFNAAAVKEGRDVDENFYGIVLLQEAVDAGWKDE
ncbi:uncharacterized protein EV420DRAFT_1766818 [Desarmillaria tabescens]|uniref:Chromo domain-containing protein n=1 Tax=Armillaria tabescens TaxID=1929756 RepID=A0AA39JXN1_ARMTA|nr:uncharacterized protein EV420DRAFT_1766818 [Desarmillaria tabescens]KAK0449711.1 hypothetical protein EV420DRAFT_1766818 [Desarmillaria tabescens]